MPYKDIETRREHQRKKYQWNKENNPEKLRKEYQREYRVKNKEQVKEKRLLWYHKNKESINKKATEFKKNNPDKIKGYRKKHHEINKEKRNQYGIKKRKENPEYFRKYEKNRRETNPLYKLKKNVQSRIRCSINRGGFKKNGKTEIILGIDYETFKKHLERQWEPWMSWDNYGKYKKDTFNYGWDIDHIIPTSSAKTEEELYKLNHYTNLKPLCSKVNRDIKKAKQDVPDTDVGDIVG
jgi:hypothetical protein